MLSHSTQVVGGLSSFVTQATMSSDLVWELVRPWNCYQLKRTHPKRRFTTEKGSMTGTVTPLDCGLARRHAVHIEADENGVPELALKNTADKNARKPDKMWTTISLRGGARKAISKTMSAIQGYSPTASKRAVRKVSLLARAQARANAGINHKNVKTGRTSRR